MENQKYVTTLPTEEPPALVERVIALPPCIRVPLSLAHDPALAPWDWRIITGLLIFANNKGHTWPSRRTLAAALGLPDNDWPRSFYARLRGVPRRRQDGRTFYLIALDPDGRCAWLPNSICRWQLTATGWRILIALQYVCLSDALSVDPGHDPQGPLEISPHHYQRILQHAGFNDTKNQRLRYVRRAFDEFTEHGWLEDGDYVGAYFLQLPKPISKIVVSDTAKRYCKNAWLKVA